MVCRKRIRKYFADFVNDKWNEAFIKAISLENQYVKCFNYKILTTRYKNQNSMKNLITKDNIQNNFRKSKVILENIEIYDSK
jgi:hypothetical protein